MQRLKEAFKLIKYKPITGDNMNDITMMNKSECIDALNKEILDLKEDIKWKNAEIPALKNLVRRLYKDINVRTRVADRMNA